MIKDAFDIFKTSSRIALVIMAIGAGSVGLVAGAKAAFAATLKTEGSVSGDYILLGDVFENVDNADYVLGPAPTPGKDMILNARTLYRIASALNVDWQPSSSMDQLILRRDAVIIPQKDVTAELEKYIGEKNVDGDFSISYTNEPDNILLPSGSDATLEITAFNFDPQRDSFDAVLVAPSAANPLRRVNVSGRIERMISVPVLKNTLKSGDIIGVNDIEWIDQPESKLANGVLVHEEDLIDMTPRRTAFAGKPLIANELEPPKLVSRGDAITLVFETGPLVLTAKGKALQGGAVGDVIRVSNSDSNKSLQGTVTGDREVTIR